MEYQNYGIFKLCNIKIMEYLNYGILKLWNIKIMDIHFD